MIEFLTNKWIFLVVILIVAFLTYQYILLLRNSRDRDDYGRVKVSLRLIWAFVIFCGLSSIYAEVICNFFGIKSPKTYEFYSLIALFIVSLFSYLILKVKKKEVLSDNHQESVYDKSQSTFYNDISYTPYQASRFEVFLEFVGLATLAKKFDIDINIDRTETAQNAVYSSGYTENTSESAYNPSLNSYEMPDFQPTTNIESLDIPEISISDEIEGASLGDISLDDIV